MHRLCELAKSASHIFGIKRKNENITIDDHSYLKINLDYSKQKNRCGQGGQDFGPSSSNQKSPTKTDYGLPLLLMSREYVGCSGLRERYA